MKNTKMIMETKNKRIVIIGLLLINALSAIAIKGSWRGNLNVGVAKIPLVLNFTEKDGSTTCTMDSPNQNAYGLPATIDYISADSIAISANSIGASFKGRMSNDEIKGIFAQSGRQFPLSLNPEQPLSERRPQTPIPPFPYTQIDTVFTSADGTLLAGTITLPDSYSKDKTPICVLVTGSGPQNRDEEIFEHKPFAVIADFLGRNGVATFRYDDRGTAASKGNYATATLDTFREDAKAALLFAKTFTNRSAGVIGHSEGGTIAMLLAQERIPDFVVSLAGMAISGKETVMTQNKRQLQKLGFDEKSIDNSMILLNTVFDEIISQTSSGESTPIDVDTLVGQLGLSVPGLITQSLKNNLSKSNQYFGNLLSTDVRKGLSKISCPLLALNGSLDTQVIAAENLDAIRNGVKDAKVVELQGLNHLFQHAKTGDVSEYSQINETISPEALSLILSFIQEQ